MARSVVAQEPAASVAGGPQHTIVESKEEAAAPVERTHEQPSAMQTVLADLQKHSQQHKSSFLVTVPAAEADVIREVEAWPMGWQVMDSGVLDDSSVWLLFRRSVNTVAWSVCEKCVECV